MGMIRPYPVIFNTGATYSCYSNKGDFADLEEKVLPINPKGGAKGLDIFEFGIV